MKTRILWIAMGVALISACNSGKTKEEKQQEELVKDSVVNEEIDNLIKDLEESFEQNVEE